MNGWQMLPHQIPFQMFIICALSGTVAGIIVGAILWKKNGGVKNGRRV